MPATAQHIPVLCAEVLDGLDVRPGGRYVDATLGAAELAAEILRASAPDGELFGLDADPEAIGYARQALAPFADRATLQVGNFGLLEQFATNAGFGQVDGVVMDLGLSSRQLAAAGRGFSFSHDGPLDMRFDPGQGRPAADLVNRLPEAELADLIWRYGEERQSRRIARAIVAARPVSSSGQLAGLVARAIGHKEKIHPATRTFQALRIAVNDELEVLARALPQARNLLRPKGRMAVISFHSLEDRIVKQFFLQEARDCLCSPDVPLCTCRHRATLKVVTRHPLRPGEEEMSSNPRSRSAKLRIAERLESTAGD